MRKRFAIAGAAVTLLALSAGLTLSTALGSSSAGTILIGISAAKTGILAPYDLQAGQLFQMRIKQLDKAGGVLGKQIKVEWIDTKSDKPTAAANADELISKGAVAIIATCDFEFSFPAIHAARAKGVPGIALCASSPKVATPAIVGPYGGSMGLGSDAEGVTMAEWMRAKKPAWKSVYVFKDNSLEYSKATADYFKARFTQLGGKVCGEDTFVGGANLDLSSQITRLRGKVKNCDAIFDGSWQPYVSARVGELRGGHPDADHDECVRQRRSRHPGRGQGLELLRRGVRLSAHLLQRYADAAGPPDRAAVPEDLPHAARKPLRPAGVRPRRRARRRDQGGGV